MMFEEKKESMDRSELESLQLERLKSIVSRIYSSLKTANIHF